MLLVFDDMIADVEADKKLSPAVSKSLLKGREINISFVFDITILFQSA